MTTETVTKADIRVRTSIFIDGTPDAQTNRLDSGAITLNVGMADIYFHGGAQAFKAWVGKLIAEAAKLD